MDQLRPLFLLIFVLFKYELYRKNCGFSRFRTQIVRVEGEHADHLTTTTADWMIVIFNLILIRIYFALFLSQKQQQEVKKSGVDFMRRHFST